MQPLKRGMVNASQQLSVGNTQVENPKNNLSPYLLEIHSYRDEKYGSSLKKPILRDAALDPKTRDQALDCKVRDIASDPMVNEKGTDPKMHDMATEAWKRDGGV